MPTIYDHNHNIKILDPTCGSGIFLVEGFKQADIPKIEVYRADLGLTLLAITDNNIIAVATDEQLTSNVLTLDLNNMSAIADFIILKFLKLSVP